MPNAQRGSALILVLIAVLLLSLIGIAGLENTSLETGTNRQFMADKTAFYSAETGLNVGINEIRKSLYPPEISLSPTATARGMIYRTGTLESSASQPVKAYLGFKAPPPRGISIEMCSEIGATIALWELTVAAEGDSDAINSSIRNSRKQISAVIAAFAPEY